MTQGDRGRTSSIAFHLLKHCCGSVTFRYESGSADPYLWLMDSDPAIFVIDLQDANKNFFFLSLYSVKVHLHHFSNIKSHQEATNQSRNQGFSYYFCLMIEGSGSVLLINGSGSRRHKHIWIRIPNTLPKRTKSRATVKWKRGMTRTTEDWQRKHITDR